jgi:pimeloyl-ACP methyl ester carboxylesterase
MTSELTIGKLAERTEVHPRTIRFYEAKGLLPPPRRSASGYRLYSLRDVKRLGLVRAARALGFSIREVHHLMAVAQRLIPGSRMVVVPGAGHSVYFEEPETFNRLVLEFFRSCPQ